MGPYILNFVCRDVAARVYHVSRQDLVAFGGGVCRLEQYINYNLSGCTGARACESA